jgi:hypothetical protein
LSLSGRLRHSSSHPPHLSVGTGAISPFGIAWCVEETIPILISIIDNHHSYYILPIT